jgi:ADP-heptose:LPS heptosyltransferase
MNINQMRTIDKLAGIPLCALLSLVRRFLVLFAGQRPESPPRRILFIEMSEMGSMVLAYSMLMKAETLFPGSDFFFLTFHNHRYAVDVLKKIPKDHVVTIDPSSLYTFLTSALSAVWRLRRLRLDAVVDMELFSRFSAILSFLCGARIRSGFYPYHQEGLYRGSFITHPVQFNPHLHISRNLLALVLALSPKFREKPMVKTFIPDKDIVQPRFQASTEEKEALKQKICRDYPGLNGSETLILLNPNAGDIVPLRRWPLSRYIHLGRLLLDHPGILLLITGTAEERRQAERLAHKINAARCINFAGRTSFRELMVLYDMSHILVTNDSGPAHFSTMTGIRSFVLFGPETPHLYGPLSKQSRVFYAGLACSPCVSAYNHRRTPCRNNLCLQAISSAQVYREIKLWLPPAKKAHGELNHE